MNENEEDRLDSIFSGLSYKRREPVYQVSTLQSLVMGNYYGSIDVSRLLEHGDTGLGMYAAADGELIAIDGHCYRVLGDGSAVLAKSSDVATFASIAYLVPGEIMHFGKIANIEGLRSALDERTRELGTNNIYVVRLDGHFKRVAARTETKQREPFRPFKEVLKTSEKRFVFNDIDGSLVCFYFPAYLEGVNTPGWHFHFINHERDVGGHVFDLELTEGRAVLNKTDRFVMDLPHCQAFQDAVLENASKEDIKAIEQGGAEEADN